MPHTLPSLTRLNNLPRWYRGQKITWEPTPRWYEMSEAQQQYSRLRWEDKRRLEDLNIDKNDWERISEEDRAQIVRELELVGGDDQADARLEQYRHESSDLDWRRLQPDTQRRLSEEANIDKEMWAIMSESGRERALRKVDRLSWQAVPYDMRKRLADEANITKETWNYLSANDRISIWLAPRVIEAVPEWDVLDSWWEEEWVVSGRDDYETRERMHHKLGSIEWDDPVFSLIVAIRDADVEGVSRALARGARRDIMVRVDGSRLNYVTASDYADDNDATVFDDRIPKKYRDPDVRVLTLQEWLDELIDMEDDGKDDSFSTISGRRHDGVAYPEYFARLRRVRARVFYWLRASFLWKMRALVFYWAEIAAKSDAPDRLDMAAELREAMEGMEGAVGSRLKIN